ncbi:hypothetical protein [Streptomyces violascens]|uniref:hypothetical protein n=1 Tax=Streptomyces violascens TaxID=67381 RepID=UPI0016784D41|nr:hypothetical protein [Streptomyces violascens]GGU52675.1 hypothetical protein GCM10010289_86050 [Streptomyces violascens]
MELVQLDVPATDPGFRLDLEGRARFVHEGYTVDVLVRRPNEQDALEYIEAGEILVIGTVVLEGLEVANVTRLAEESDGSSMRETLEQVLRDAVENTRRMVARLAARVEKTDRAHQEQQP